MKYSEMGPFMYLKSVVLNLRMDYCCWLFPVRFGLIVTIIYNILMAVVSIMAVANATFRPILLQVQEKLNQDTVTTAVPMLAYITEIGFSSLCLCGIFRKDLVLLRVYFYYCISALVLTFMVYSLAILALDWLTHLVILLTIFLQTYIILLVRSLIVEIRWEKKEMQLPKFIMSTLAEEDMKDRISIESTDVKEKDHVPDITVEIVEVTEPTSDVEIVAEPKEIEAAPEPEKKDGHKKEIEPKLETVKEESS